MMVARQDKLVEKRRLFDIDIAQRRLSDGAYGTSADFTDALDYMWLIVCGALVMFMQAGFAILESGACRAKNGGMVLTKNILDVCVGTLVWYILGYGLAYG